MLGRRENFLKERKGAVLLEFVLCFPILLVLFFFAIQLAQIMITWQVVHYAAYMGARSSMVTNNIQRQTQAEKVVKRILAVVSASPATDSQSKKSGNNGGNKDTERTKDEYCKLDGWGYLPDTKYLEKQVSVDIPLDDQAYALNPALLADDPQTIEPDKDLKIPYIELSSTSVVNIPYGTKAYPLDIF